jgi:DNA-binding HxlR family transcriptional regulator
MNFRECVLSSLSAKWGSCASDLMHLIGRQPGAETDALHKAAIRRELKALERDGLVRRMDEDYPIAYMLTNKEPTC